MIPRHLLEPARLAGGALLRAQSDARLVELTRAGNDRAFEAIVARYKGDLLRYCSRILPDGRGEDAVQQSFVNAYRALHHDTTPLSLRSWLFSIGHNASLNILRQRGGDHEPLHTHPGTAEATHATVERRERLREVLAAVAALPPGQRDAIVLRELEGRGHEEIARALGVTGGAARQLISRARNGIRNAAAAVFPMPLLMRLTADQAPTPTAERLAELTAAGSGVAVGKVVATAAIGGTLIGGGVAGLDLVDGGRNHSRADVAEAAPSETADRQDRDKNGGEDSGPGDSSGPGSGGGGDRRASNSERESGDDGPGDDNSGPGSGERDDEEDEHRSGSNPVPGDDDDYAGDDNSGPGSSDDDDNYAGDDGSGDDDDDYAGGDGSGDDDDDYADEDNSGPGSGDDDDNYAGDDNSDPGSGDDDDDDHRSGSNSGSGDYADDDDFDDRSGSGED